METSAKKKTKYKNDGIEGERRLGKGDNTDDVVSESHLKRQEYFEEEKPTIDDGSNKYNSYEVNKESKASVNEDFEEKPSRIARDYVLSSREEVSGERKVRLLEVEEEKAVREATRLLEEALSGERRLGGEGKGKRKLADLSTPQGMLRLLNLRIKVPADPFLDRAKC